MGSERNLLVNGRFQHGLDGWAASGGAYYNAGSGSEQYGVASVPVGGQISQSFAVERARTYTLHLMILPWIDLAGAEIQLTIADGAGRQLLVRNMTGTLGTWNDNTFTLGLVPGGSYTLTLANVSGGGVCHLDDVWLWWVPLNRAQLAARVHARLDRLATDRGYVTTPGGALTEGDYTYAVDAGLRASGALDPETDQPDVRYLDGEKLNAALEAIELEMLERMARAYALEVDTQAGSRRSAYSQISRAVAQLAGESNDRAGTRVKGHVVARTLRHTGDEVES